MTDRSTDDLARFDVVERVLHWTTAGMFAVLMLTAVPLYLGSVSSIIGRRALVADIHTWTGVALPVPLLVSLVGPWGGGLRADVRRFSRWSVEELRWLRTRGRTGVSRMGKFNPGQKLNAVFVAGAIVVMLGTGAVLRWFGPFPVSWRTGATFVHDVLATAIFVVVAGHVAFAVTHRDALASMFTGRISRRWARRHAPAWLEEIDPGRDDGSGPRPQERDAQMPRGRRELSQPSRATAQRNA
ncbi:MAG TPA: cytochrome b/b6 domain-containing protein [Acidimicrobiales bacterium]|nr:cytochrome b/b6 domain-containing protein [Acidimicrobiales bacterium]